MDEVSYRGSVFNETLTSWVCNSQLRYMSSWATDM